MSAGRVILRSGKVPPMRWALWQGTAPEPPPERPRMTTQVPPGPEHAVAPHDYPQFVMGDAQYPPPAHEHHPRSDEPVSAYPAVSYPQQGATGYPMPVPYPQPGTQPPPAAYPTAPPWAPQPA